MQARIYIALRLVNLHNLHSRFFEARGRTLYAILVCITFAANLMAIQAQFICE